MGFKQVRTSDLSGADLPDDQVVTVYVRNHPDLEDGRVFDASRDEMSGLKPITNMVELEMKDLTSGQTSQVTVTKADFAKLVPEDKLKAFDSTRGRRSGFKPNGNGNSRD